MARQLIREKLLLEFAVVAPLAAQSSSDQANVLRALTQVDEAMAVGTSLAAVRRALLHRAIDASHGRSDT